MRRLCDIVNWSGEPHSEDATAFRRRSSIWETFRSASVFPDPMPLASGTAGGATLLCEVGLPSGRSILPSESRCILRSTPFERRVSQPDCHHNRSSVRGTGPQKRVCKSILREAKSKRCQKPEDRSSFCFCPIVRSTLSAQNETGHIHAAGPRERSGAHQYAAGSLLTILHNEAQKGWAELVVPSRHPDSST